MSYPDQKLVGGANCRDLALGTVQLGRPYGVANTTGQPDQLAANAIVGTGWVCGVRYFDTAQSYGVSESVLGTALASQPESTEARIVTKLELGLGGGDGGEIIHSLKSSLARLRQASLWGVLLHNEDDLDHWGASAHDAFREARKEGLLHFAGVSVYSPERALQALGCDGIDIIQVPANIFDRRMKRAGVFEKAAQLGKQIFIRSVYLQGLAVMSLELVRNKMPFASSASERLHRFVLRHGIAPQRFAIDHVRREAPGAKIIVGAETAAQIRENCAHFMAPPLPADLHQSWTEEWRDDVLELIDPRLWPARKASQG